MFSFRVTSIRAKQEVEACRSMRSSPLNRDAAQSSVNFSIAISVISKIVLEVICVPLHAKMTKSQ